LRQKTGKPAKNGGHEKVSLIAEELKDLNIDERLISRVLEDFMPKECEYCSPIKAGKFPAMRRHQTVLAFGPQRSAPLARKSNTCISTKSFGIKKINQYTVLKTLGSGATSKVVHCL
jgi:serine/threonine protein kinase